MKESFEVRLEIKDQNGKIITLEKVVELEVKDEKAVVPQEVVFEKDGQKFQIIIEELDLWYGLFKRGVRSFANEAPTGASYEIYLGEPNPGPEPIKETNEEIQHYIRFVNPWIKKRVVAASLFLVLAVVFVIIVYWYKNRKK